MSFTFFFLETGILNLPAYLIFSRMQVVITSRMQDFWNLNKQKISQTSTK